MKISDLISMCVRNLTRRKFRTFLTVMGVVIGTCFIVLPISLGIAIGENYTAMMESWGDLTLIQIYNHGNTETPLTDESIAAINAINGVDIATPIMEMNLQSSVRMFAGRKNRYQWYAWNIIGMEPEAIAKLGYTVDEGSLFEPDPTPSYSNKKKIKVLFGSQTAYDFEDTKKRWPNNMINIWNVAEGEEVPDPFFDPTTTDLILEIGPLRDNSKPITYDVEVTGVLTGDYRKGYETMYGAIITIDDMKEMIEDYNKENNIKKDKDAVEGYTNARVKCTSVDKVAEVEQQIQDMGFTNTSSMEQERQNMMGNAETIQLIAFIIGSVVLVASALSIMNTMIMSVYERTREIGVMKVLGCEVGTIRAEFLLEAGLIGFLGGVLGNGISYLLSFVFNRFGGKIGELLGMGGGYGYRYGSDVAQKLSVIPPWLLILGLVFSTLIGLVSGIIPAMRAVKISALEAIRTE